MKQSVPMDNTGLINGWLWQMTDQAMLVWTCFVYLWCCSQVRS